MSLLGRAIKIAATAHEGQVDRAGKPYILHPLRVMMKMQDEFEMIVAVLHDVMEDAPEEYDLEKFRSEGFSEEILSVLADLTHRRDEPYENHIKRLSQNNLARKVKLADLVDNMDMSRFDAQGYFPSMLDWKRMEKYFKAYKTLLE